jgi:16S rRNA (guanine527-N7)-methyltransferase
MESAPVTVADLGSGGGVPGLVLGLGWSAGAFALVEANHRRAHFLRGAVHALGLEERVQVVEERAEHVGRDPEYRNTFDAVVARSFGSPAVTAECAAPLLKVGAWLVVSEPPGSETSADHDRWPSASLARLGMEGFGTAVHRYRYHLLRQVAPCPAAYPRRNGVPAKRPLF